MKARNYWYLLVIGALLVIVPIVSAIVTATGAFGADPGQRVNRVDIVWAVIGFLLVVFSYYRIRLLKQK